MSMDRCCQCSRPVDTDFDLECYQPDPRHSLAGHPDICICENCREECEDEHGDGEPDFSAPELDMLQADAELAWHRYLEAKGKHDERAR